jgi:tetratricopeptide (TPR) repeat protein
MSYVLCLGSAFCFCWLSARVSDFESHDHRFLQSTFGVVLHTFTTSKSQIPIQTMYYPEDKDQALVETPYGQGVVVRTRTNPDTEHATIREIELLDWTKPYSGRGPNKVPNMLYSPLEFPSVAPMVGSEVSTLYGRGKVSEVREGGQMVVVNVSSWRLAGRSTVMCYLSTKSVQVIRPKKVFDMTIFEKVEHAQQLKKQASSKFSEKQYSEALHLYAEAVDAVRYVQHKKDSTNELRADLLIVMITCCNNAATCCVQLKEWDRAQKFSKNALVLLEALDEKKGNSNILKLLNREGTTSSKLFGTWMVKSRLVVARGLAERHDPNEAIENLKKAQEMISEYKKEGDPMLRQLQNQEKEVRKLLTTCKDMIKVDRKKEKQRARAMFSGTEEKKDQENHKERNESQATGKTERNVIFTEEENDDIGVVANDVERSGKEQGIDADILEKAPPKKRVSFADGTAPGSVDDSAEPSLFEEHKEAMLVIFGLALGSLCVHMLSSRRR